MISLLWAVFPVPAAVFGQTAPAGLTGTLRTDYYTIQHHPDHADDAEKVDGYLQAAIGRLKQEFDATDVDERLTGIDCRVFLYPEPTDRASSGTTTLLTGSRREGNVDRYYAELHQLTPAAHRGGGDDRTSVGEVKDQNYVERVLVHEYATVLLERITRSKPRGWTFYSAPAWFTQGYEEYLGLTCSNEHSHDVTFRKYLDVVVADAQRVRNDFGLVVTDPYVDGAILVAFMHEHYGKRKVQAILTSDALTFGAAARSTLGVTLDEFFAHWETWRDSKQAGRTARGESAGSSRGESRGAVARTTVRVAGIVLKWLRTEKDANFRRAEALIREAAAGGAQIVCTTECFLDGYAIKDKDIPLAEYRALGEQVPGGPFYERLAALADELDIHLIAGMLEADGEQRYNTAALISPEGTLAGKYRKHELGHEAVRNTPGTELPVFATPYGRMGLMICADRTSRELVGTLRANGAEFILCPSGGMFGPKSNDPIVQARSKENRLPIVFVHPAEFLVTGPDGDIRARTILGDRLEIETAEVGGVRDENEVFYFDLALSE
jgi:predicted amidohydrolase